MKVTLILLLLLAVPLWAQPVTLEKLLQAPLPRSRDNLRQIRGHLENQPENLNSLTRRPKGRGKVPILVYAIESVDLPLAQVLLDSGADPNTVYGRGERPALQAAVLSSTTDRTRSLFIQLLLSGKTDIRSTDTLERTVFHALVESRDWQQDKALKRVAHTLLKAGAPLETEDVRGFTPLLSAVMRHDARMVRILLELGADPKRKSQPLGVDAYTLAEQQSHTLDHPVEAKAVQDALSDP